MKKLLRARVEAAKAKAEDTYSYAKAEVVYAESVRAKVKAKADADYTAAYNRAIKAVEGAFADYEAAKAKARAEEVK
ncbi:MAG: hypothetical protein GY820_21210 [Gammaproteobacteria bacterium]|nr:hypothetical protein [Gammaproteobacteria bacterium]